MLQLIFFHCFGAMVMCANESETKEKQKLTQIKNELQHIQDINILASQKSSNSWKIVKLTSLNNIVSFVHLRVFLSYFFCEFSCTLIWNKWYSRSRADSISPWSSVKIFHSFITSSWRKEKNALLWKYKWRRATKKYLQLWLYFDDQINVVELF